MQSASPAGRTWATTVSIPNSARRRRPGGWEGMKRLRDTVRELGYPFILHDQYRDYYTDAPCLRPAIRRFTKKTINSPPSAFPGTRFGDWKEGTIPFMNHWDGGKQTLSQQPLHARPLEEELSIAVRARHSSRRAFTLTCSATFRPTKISIPNIRRRAPMRCNARIACYNWARAQHRFHWHGSRLRLDRAVRGLQSPLRSNKGVPVPLFNLVYHDAIITPYRQDLARFPERRRAADLGRPRRQRAVGRRWPAQGAWRALHSASRCRRWRSTNSSTTRSARSHRRSQTGRRVTVDWDAKTVTIQPDVKIKG